jgi:hypothetical protein
MTKVRSKSPAANPVSPLQAHAGRRWRGVVDEEHWGNL